MILADRVLTERRSAIPASSSLSLDARGCQTDTRASPPDKGTVGVLKSFNESLEPDISCISYEPRYRGYSRALANREAQTLVLEQYDCARIQVQADTISPCRRFSNLRLRSVQTSKKWGNYEDCSEPFVGKTLSNTVNVRRVPLSGSIHRSRSITHIQSRFQA